MRFAALALFGSLALAAPNLAYAQPALDWQRYTIADSGAHADVPRAIFSEDGGAAQEGSGRRFTTADGRADLTVQSIPNPNRAPPATFLASRNPPSGIIYRRVTPRFFAVSSVRNGRIWYNRCNRGGAAMHCVLINYPATEKRRFDSVVSRISLSLRGG
ncbi:hypothetical protein [Rhodopseudomonas sp. B29]|uniref:hypothetical protein n=1 Tax=Rhodopseudomonas sp. B29 TaxID=95607 RepID=UPI0003449E8B|nr:hypothetical protein [Rhodopseudomonas sp. B29]